MLPEMGDDAGRARSKREETIIGEEERIGSIGNKERIGDGKRRGGKAEEGTESTF